MFRKLLFISLFIPFFTFAQNNGVVAGRVTEASSAQPLEFVTLVLMRPGEQVIIKQVVTDNKGQYKISGLAIGTYYIIASYIGFDNLKTNNFVISTGAKGIVQDISLNGAALQQLPANSIERNGGVTAMLEIRIGIMQV
jgi:hypothetical protein